MVYQFMPIVMFKILNFGMKTLLFEQEPGLQIEITDSDFPLQYFELFFYDCDYPNI